MVKVGEAYAGFGDYDKALTLIQAGIKKGVTKTYDAQMALGQAYLNKGQREAAAKAFAAVPKTDAKGWNIAHLFNIYARSNASQASNTPPRKKKH
jgi:tetratricopeptide (TPR) repeat protein